jgi:hypothetical protein
MRLHPATRMMLMVSDVSLWYVHQRTNSCASGHWVALRCLMLSRQDSDGHLGARAAYREASWSVLTG